MQAGVEVPTFEMVDAVQKLGTLCGWLTFYGNLRLSISHGEAVKKVIGEGKIIVKTEFQHFLQRGRNKRLYLRILQAVKYGATWSELYETLGITKSRLSEALGVLQNHSFIIKRNGKYIIADKMFFHAF